MVEDAAAFSAISNRWLEKIVLTDVVSVDWRAPNHPHATCDIEDAIKRVKMQFASMDGPFGTFVGGLDLNFVDDGDLRAIAARLFEDRILAVRNQALSHDDYVRFGKRWGRPVMLIKKTLRVGTHPEMIRQSNSASIPQYLRNVASHWHCDSAYEEEAASVTMLLGVEAPACGGETLFADMAAAYDALDRSTKSQIAAACLAPRQRRASSTR